MQLIFHGLVITNRVSYCTMPGHSNALKVLLASALWGFHRVPHHHAQAASQQQVPEHESRDALLRAIKLRPSKTLYAARHFLYPASATAARPS